MTKRSTTYRFGEFRVDPSAARVYRDERPLALEPKAFDVLCFLVENPGRLVEKQELLDAVWRDAAVTENAMTRVVAQLRRALGDTAKEARYIETVPTRGYRFIGDVAAENGARGPAEASRPRRSSSPLLALLFGILLGTGGALLLLRDPETRRSVRRVVLPLNGPTIEVDWSSVFDLAPAGDQLVFVGREPGSIRKQLFLRSLDSGSVLPIAGTEGAMAPFFAPDGEAVAYFRDNRLMKVPLEGGAPETLATSNAPWPPKMRGDWVSADAIDLIYPGLALLKLERVSLGGTRRLLGEIPVARTDHVSWVDVLSHGRAAVISTRTGPNPEDCWIELLDLATGKKSPIASGYHGVVSPTGHLVYVANGALVAAPFDPGEGRIGGEAMVLEEAVLSDPLVGAALFALSDEGTLAFLSPIPSANLSLVWADREGRTTVALSAPFRSFAPVLSPNGRVVAFRNMATREARALWLLDLASGQSRRLPLEGNPVSFVWTPDGSGFAFAWDRETGYNLYSQYVVGESEAVRLTKSSKRQFPKSFSPLARLLAYEEETELEGPRDIWFLELEGGRAKSSRPFLTTRADEREPAFSPDGKLLAFQTNESGRSEIEIASVATGERFRVSTEGGREPVWTKGSKEIVFRNGNQMLAVKVEGGDPPELGYPRHLFTNDFVSPGHRNYDVTPDGEKFLGVRVEGLEPYDSVELLLDWPAKLAR